MIIPKAGLEAKWSGQWSISFANNDQEGNSKIFFYAFLEDIVNYLSLFYHDKKCQSFT